MGFDENQQDAQSIAKYLSNRKVLIVTPTGSIRSSIAEIFRDLGAQEKLTLLVNTFHQAQSAILWEKPQIVVAEYDLGKRCGLELLQAQREQRPNDTKECLFAIVTSNSSQIAVARSAEEDVDAYFIKPFTPETVRKTLLDAAAEKIRPRQYKQVIESGKDLMNEGDLEGAERLFEQAIAFDKAPALAYYYVGQTKVMRDIFSEARLNYNKGLAFNRIHYKCLVGLYELLMIQREHKAAYSVVRRISQYFPTNPKRLAEVLRLAIITASYEDIERYYTIFSNIDERDENLIKYVSAALVVCGKHYLSSKLGNARALELFRKAVAVAQGRAKIIREIVLALIDYRLINDAKAFLTHFPPESCDSDDFLLLTFLIACESEGSRASLEQGRVLISKGIVDEHLYVATIKAAVQSCYDTLAENLTSEAVALFPERRAYFEEVFKRSKSAA